MREHVLIEKAFMFDNVKEPTKPKGCYYDRSVGLWRVDGTGEVMMLSDSFDKPATKKCDIETGEDQKGE